MEQWIIAALAFLVGLFGNSFLKSYMSKKGENLATHEDVEKLVAQMSAVTQTTKQIESKISGELWDKQRRWEMKKDVLLETLTRLSKFREAVLDEGALGGIPAQDEAERDEWIKRKQAAIQVTKGALTELVASQFQALAVCGEPLTQTFQEVTVSLLSLSQEMLGGPPPSYLSSVLANGVGKLTAAIREDLGVI